MTTLDEQRHVFERLKQAIKALEAKRACPYGHLSDYPPVIADCHKPMVQYAYNGERPIEADMPELDIIMMGTQLRTRGATPKKTRKLLFARNAIDQGGRRRLRH